MILTTAIAILEKSIQFFSIQQFKIIGEMSRKYYLAVFVTDEHFPLFSYFFSRNLLFSPCPPKRRSQILSEML